MIIAISIVIAVVVAMSVLSLMLGVFRRLDRTADDIQDVDPQAARELRQTREDMDRSKGYYGSRQ